MESGFVAAGANRAQGAVSGRLAKEYFANAPSACTIVIGAQCVNGRDQVGVASLAVDITAVSPRRQLFALNTLNCKLFREGVRVRSCSLSERNRTYDQATGGPRPYPDGMAEAPTQDQVIEAARSVGSEFTREDVAEKLGVEVSEMRPSWKALKEADRLKKVRTDDGKRYFSIK
jgi:hypothetical protein